MDATCRFCGKPATLGATLGEGATCGTCAKRDQRRRMIFDVSESGTSTRYTGAPSERPSSEPSSPPEEMRMLDLLALARRTRQALETVPEAADVDVPLSVREAILLVDSIAPASLDAPPTRSAPPAIDAPPAQIEPPPPPAKTSSTPARRRLHAIYSGVGLLVVMAAMVAAKATMGHEVASTAALAPEEAETTAPLSATPQAPSTAASPVATTQATTKPAVTPPMAPPRPAPPRPKPPVAAPAETAVVRAAAEPTATPRVDLLDAMAAAVAAHSAPPGPPAAPRVDCPPISPGGSGTPSPCARAGTRTSPLRP